MFYYVVVLLSFFLIPSVFSGVSLLVIVMVCLLFFLCLCATVDFVWCYSFAMLRWGDPSKGATGDQSKGGNR